MSSSISHGVALGAAAALSTWLAAVPAAQAASPANAAATEHARVIGHWTPERRAAASPRDLLLDARGQAYLRRGDGSLEPYGRRIAAAAPAPQAKPVDGDSTAPDITGWNPTAGATIGTSHTFSARIVDAGGLRSVRFILQRSDSIAQSFSPTLGSGDVWSIALTGFTAGSAWTWRIEATDRAGNKSTKGPFAFGVASDGGGVGGNVVTNAEWTTAGALQTAAGRIYFEMPANARRTRWAGYVCSGTVVADGNTSGRSIILTAAHCVYDDQYKAFARNVLFIPNQDQTTGTSGTDRDCSNDPLGCWTPSFGVVDVNWTTRSFPDNVKWDYAFYVVNDAIDSHTGAGSDGALDARTATAAIDFASAITDDSGSADFTHALGYSYSDDPKFMYCAEDMTTEGTDNWWLPNCGLSGGSSGGPWVQPMGTGGTGPVISVNSWGYTTSPGMAGPKLNGLSTAACVFGRAKARAFPVAPLGSSAGYDETCP
jgi:hypothetical protein